MDCHHQTPIAPRQIAFATTRRVVVSSHRVLFFNVLCIEMKRPRWDFLTRQPQAGSHGWVAGAGLRWR